MSLKWYRRPKLVVLHPETPALDAARAMENNEIGAVLVMKNQNLVGIVTDRDLATRVLGQERDAKTTRLDSFMTENVATLSPRDSQTDAIDLMCRLNIRRIPLVDDGGRLVGLVTLDDLILDEQTSFEAVSSVVEAQLGSGGPAPSPRTSAAQRRTARAENTYRRMITQLQESTGLSSFEQTVTATEVVLSSMVRRLTGDESKDFIAQLPSLMQESLLALPIGPDVSIGPESIESELVKRLDIDPKRAAELLGIIGSEILQSVSPGEASNIQGQFPQELNEALSPAPAE